MTTCKKCKTSTFSCDVDSKGICLTCRRAAAGTPVHEADVEVDSTKSAMQSSMEMAKNIAMGDLLGTGMPGGMDGNMSTLL